MATYGQFCPVARAMDLLDERWTLLVVRELLSGSRHFNQLRRGVPRMSSALLSKRLRTLVDAGLVRRFEETNRVVYELTPAGEELRGVVEGLGTWGIRWMPELGDEHLDPHLLLWDLHRNLDLDAMPDGRTVLAFHLHDARPGTRDWWVVVDDGEVDLCDDDPGHEVTVRIEASLLTLTRVWLGEVSWEQAVRAGALRTVAPEEVRRRVPRWLKLSTFAGVPRPATV
jgi:DNA-binding HxlR family transcriptional regulator